MREQEITLKFIAMRFSRCFAYSFMAKVLLRCLFNKFNLYKILIKEPKQLIGFSLGAANISAIFLLFRYIV